jgi:hypothetical protein
MTQSAFLSWNDEGSVGKGAARCAFDGACQSPVAGGVRHACRMVAEQAAFRAERRCYLGKGAARCAFGGARSANHLLRHPGKLDGVEIATSNSVDEDERADPAVTLFDTARFGPHPPCTDGERDGGLEEYAKTHGKAPSSLPGW